MGCLSPMMSAEMAAAIDLDRYPGLLTCLHCGGSDGMDEEIWTGVDGEDDMSGYELWFCCFTCRDAGLPCETFYPIRLKPGSRI
jgi:hypothetical protein